MTKRVLIIANLFHASPRIPGLANYLPDYGWHTSVITPPLGHNAATRLGLPKDFLKKSHIIEAPFCGDVFWLWRHLFKKIGFRSTESITEQIKERAGIKRQRSFIDFMMKWYQTFLAYPDTEITWRKPALQAALQALRSPYDAIMSSSPFPTNHIVASELQRKFDIPWIADFRDPWTVNQNYTYPAFRKVFERNLEVRTMKSAAAIIAVSWPQAQKISELHRRTVEVLTNGFDPNPTGVFSHIKQDKFVITYTGSVYAGKQAPTKFFEALNHLLERGHVDRKDIEVRFFGRKISWLDHQITACYLDDIVKHYGMITREETLQRQRESNVLLLFNWENPEEKGIYTTKLFEYLSAGRLILATGGYAEDDVDRILLKTNAGIHAPTVEKIEAALLQAFVEYKKSGDVVFRGNLDEINQFSYPMLAKKLATFLDRTSDRS